MTIRLSRRPRPKLGLGSAVTTLFVLHVILLLTNACLEHVAADLEAGRRAGMAIMALPQDGPVIRRSLS